MSNIKSEMWNLEKYANNEAIICDDGNSLSYRELNDVSFSLYNNIERRCLVFILCNNDIGSLIGYVSFINHGIVPMLLNANIDNKSFSNLVDLYLPTYIWKKEEDSEINERYTVVTRIHGYVLLRTNYEKEYNLNPNLALLLTTSGSTGSPKFVRQSYKNIKANTESIISYLHLDETERPITTLPMYYTYGLSIINTHLAVGATILLTDKAIMQREFLEFLKNQKATSFGGVPYTYEMLDKLRFEKLDFPSLRTMTQAGGKLSVELHEKFARLADKKGQKFVVMYGQCEATARMSYLPPEYAIVKKGSVGIAIPGGRFSIIDDNDDEIKEAGVSGELVYEGDNVTLGYAECGDDLKKGDERKGRLFTGDIAKFDKDGFYYIVGRKKRFLKMFGKRVNLDELDALIKKECGIEAISSGIDDHMYIFITENKKENIVRDYVIEKTKINPVAIKVIKINEMPISESGKVMYKELERWFR